MVRIRFRQPDGAVSMIEAESGESLMTNAKIYGVEGIIAECGGSMVCGTCHIYVEEPWFSDLPKATAMETEMLDYALHRQPNSRLACQVQVTDVMEGMEVGIPQSQR